MCAFTIVRVALRLFFRSPIKLFQFKICERSWWKYEYHHTSTTSRHICCACCGANAYSQKCITIVVGYARPCRFKQKSHNSLVICRNRIICHSSGLSWRNGRKMVRKRNEKKTTNSGRWQHFSYAYSCIWATSCCRYVSTSRTPSLEASDESDNQNERLECQYKPFSVQCSISGK